MMSNGSYTGSSNYSFHMEKPLENSTKFRERSESQAKTLNEIQNDDSKSILQLERELNNCFQEIDYLQDQLNEKNLEMQSLQEHVCNLQLKLIDMKYLEEEVKRLREELMMSVSERSYLLQELENNFVELYNGKQLIEKLEKSISCTELDFQCEIEGLKLNLLEMDQKYLEANKENERMKVLIQELEVQIKEEEHMKNRHLKNKDMIKPIIGEISSVSEGESSKCCVDPRANLSELIKFQTSNTKLKEKINEYELLVEKLKSELKEEKSKAKEEAEDLAQEMAELKYQLTSLLEAEYQRRASVERKSLQRISELEDELEKERLKSFNHQEQVKSAIARRRIEAS